MEPTSENALLTVNLELLQAAKTRHASGTTSLPSVDEDVAPTEVDVKPPLADASPSATDAAPPKLSTDADPDMDFGNVFDDCANEPNHDAGTMVDEQDFLAVTQEYVKAGNFAKAEQYYLILLSAAEGNPALRVEVAQFYQKQGKTAESIAVLEPWLKAEPDSVEAIQSMGQALCADNQFDACEQLLMAALTRGISSVKLYYWLGEALRQQGKLRAAQTTYLLALHLSPKDMMLRLALITLVSESDPTQEYTAKTYQEAMNACLKGNVDEAVKLIQDALMLSSMNINPEAAAGHSERMMDEGLEQLIAAVKRSGDAGPALSDFLDHTHAATPEKIILRAKIKVAEGANTEAITLLEQGMQDFPESLDLVSCYAEIKETESITSAIVFLESKIRVFNDAPTIWARYGRLLIAMDQYPKALDALRKAYQLNPNEVANNNNLILACRRTENIAYALEIVKKNIDLQGESADNLLLMGSLYAEMGSLSEAGTYFSMVNKKDANDLRGVMAQALLYKNHHMTRDAILVLRSHLGSQAAIGNVDFLYLYAELLRQDKQLTDSRHSFQTLLEQDPEHVAARRSMAELLVQLGDYADAARHFRELLKTQRHDVKCLVDLAEVYELCGELSDAQDLYKEALEKKPNYLKAKQNLGFCRLRQEDFARGLEAYEVMSATTTSGFSEVSEIPFWRGEPIKGKSLLLYQNCSIAETILFARYFPYLQKMGARLHLLVQTDLVQLLIPNSDLCMDRPQMADYTLPISSLPKIFSINLSRIPSSQQYLTADFSLLERWERLLGNKKTKPLVGLAWQSEVSPEKRKPYDKVCSMDLMLFGELISARKYDFVSFQMGFEGRRQENACSYPLRSGSSFANNWADIAAGISLMDVVITNDQPVAHIAGALGIPTLLLLPSVAPWYWFSRREDSPWYASLHLIRQNMVGDWFASIRKVEEKLVLLTNQAK